MCYEYLYPYPEKLDNKPFTANYFMKKITSEGLNPIAIRVDNDKGIVFVYLQDKLSNKDKEKLDEIMEKIFREW